MTFDNRTFWNERYENEAWLGSGPGSRGVAAAYKKALLNHLIDSGAVSSILDVGCGDCCWIDEADTWLQGNSVRYLGLDISAVAIAANRQRLPTLSFDVFDLLSADLPRGFDLVICFDVLIHQCERTSFDSALRNLLASIEKYGLISYLTPGLTEPILPVVGGENILETELEFQESMALNFANIRTASVQNYGNLTDLVNTIDHGMQISSLGQYRFQTIYKLIRSGFADLM